MISIIPILFSKQNLVESSEWIELHNNNNEIEASLSTVHTIHTPVPTQKNIVVWLTTRFPGAEIDARETFVIFFLVWGGLSLVFFPLNWKDIDFPHINGLAKYYYDFYV